MHPRCVPSLSVTLLEGESEDSFPDKSLVILIMSGNSYSRLSFTIQESHGAESEVVVQCLLRNVRNSGNAGGLFFGCHGGVD